MAIITFQNEPIQLCGQLPEVGCIAPNFLLTNSDLQDVSLDNYAGKRKILSINPSLDTPTCAATARKFNQKAVSMKNTIILIVSADLPFAQCRFCETEGLKDIEVLSDFRSHFAIDYGVQIVNGTLAGLMTRAVIIIDEQNKISYTQLVSEIAHEPDYEAVFGALKKR